MDLNERIPQLGGTPDLIIATAAALGGDEPRDRIVVCGFHQARLLTVVPIPLDDRPTICMYRIRTWASTLARMELSHCALIVFGHPHAYPVKRLLSGLNTYGIGVPLAVRISDGRCYSYLPDDGCPADGVPHPPADDTDQPEEATERMRAEQMRKATDTAVELIRGAYRVAGGLAKRDHRSASFRFIRDAVARYAAGGRLTDIEAATLAIQLHDVRIRDEAISLIRHHGPLTAHVKLWDDLARRAVPPYTAPALGVLAFATWQNQDWYRAQTAIRDALIANLRDRFTSELFTLIDIGYPPRAYDVETPAEVAECHDRSSHDETDGLADLIGGLDLTD